MGHWDPHGNMLKHDMHKVLEGVTLYRRPDHEARTPTPLRRISVRRDAAGWSSVVRRLHAGRAGSCRAVLGRIHSSNPQLLLWTTAN